MDVFYYLGLIVTGFGAGLVGSLLGLGGGVFVVPALVLLFNVPQIVAVGTSNVAVVATSTAGASTYVRQRLSNIRLGLVLLISTTLAAAASSLIAKRLPAQLLSALFAVVLLYTAYTMLRGKQPVKSAPAQTEPGAGTGLGLEGTYYDPATGNTEAYTPRNVRTGMGISVLAGIVAGLLGVGGGIVQVPVMNLLMGVPLKVSSATSNYMIGITATSAAFVRYASGDINPLIAVPTVFSVFLGARLGAYLAPRIPNSRLRTIFGWVSVVIALLMIAQATGLYKGVGK